MAGETIKSPARTNTDAGIKEEVRLAAAREYVAVDGDALAATETEAADVWKTNIKVPSNAIISEIAVYNDDLDSNCSPTLTLDVGVEAAADYTSVTSGTATKHTEGDTIDADLFVDGATTLQAATTAYTVLAFDATTFGPDDAKKPVWEALGYDEDPKTEFYIMCTFAAGAATGAAGDIALKVKYLKD